MNQHLNDFLIMIKKMREEDFVYLSVVIIFFISLFFVFSAAVSFLSSNIDKVFSSDRTGTVHTLDISQYNFIAKKLHFSIPVLDGGNAEQPETASPETASSSSASQPLDKQSLVIKVLNGTTKKGLAASLSLSLTNEGFIVIKTGNEEERYATTTLFLSDSKKMYERVLLESLRKFYPDVLATTTSKTGGYDAVIIIGEK